MAKSGFNATVAARTRAAIQILESQELLLKYIELGGLPRDLNLIKQAGIDAEAANLTQSESRSESKSATVDILMSFAALQKEYASVMGVVQAIRGDIARSGESTELVTKLDDILANEAPLTVKVIVDEQTGATTRKRRRSMAQEALRAEIAKDAGALIDLIEVHGALAERRVDVRRLSALREAAEKLAGLLADRATARGAGRSATQAEQEATARQRDVWGASYRLLAALGAKDERVRSLLAEASANRY